MESLFDCISTIASLLSAADLQLAAIAFIATGGTIAKKSDPATKKSYQALFAKELLTLLPDPPKEGEILPYDFSNCDSVEMSEEMWGALSIKVGEMLKEPAVEGVVISHGTDTIAETAYFLELTLPRTVKPVILVGAMRNPSEPSSDAPANLADALALARSSKGKEWGVTVTLGHCAYSARGVRKKCSHGLDAFDGGERGPLGYVEGGKVIFFRTAERSPKFLLPKKLPKVAIVKTYAGDDGKLIALAVDSALSEGLVIEPFPSGILSRKVESAVDYALQKGVTVAIASSVERGRLLPQNLQTAKREALFCGELTSSKARILLMLALGNGEREQGALQGYFLDC